MKQFTSLNYSLHGSLSRTWVVFTKCDLIKKHSELPLEAVIEQVKEMFPEIEKSFVVSATTEENISELVTALCDTAPFSPHMFPFGNISDKPERFFATEYIREQIFELIKAEIPYEVAVVIEEYKDVVQDQEMTKQRKMRVDYQTALMGKEVRLPTYDKEAAKNEKVVEETKEVEAAQLPSEESTPEVETVEKKQDPRPEGLTEVEELKAQAAKEAVAQSKEEKYGKDKKEPKKEMERGDVISHISAAILVNRPSQRAIIIGSKGSMIKEIGTRARRKIETLTGHRVFLNLHVKVSPKWFKNNYVLEEIGLDRVQDSARVWRQR